ncbi:DUF2130 domain-containing protein [Patescibacteria group bacterium]|nr:DUF2130 domain-containing protein [Patescibacteria group bacterium]
MDNHSTNIICPNCKKRISIDQAFKSQIEDQIRQNLRDEYNEKWQNLQKKQDEKTKEEKLVLEEQLEKQKKEIDLFRENELVLRKKTAELEEKEKNLELEKLRQIDEERKKIQEETAEKMTENFHLKEKEKDQLIDSLKKSLDEAQRKVGQGSQQLQGEVLELELEEILRHEFPVDDIKAVGKGIKGADLVQVVRDPTGREAGKIVWESKRTKAFGGDWISKLKEDMREEKADVAVIISTILPQDIRFFGQKEGVHITSFECVLQVAIILRKSLIDLANTKSLSIGKNEKIESLYRYITSTEFAQKIDSMLETYSTMEKTLEKEKMITQKIWAQREKEIDRLKINTLTIHGSLSGLIEEPLPEVKSLEFEDVEVTLDQQEV